MKETKRMKRGAVVRIVPLNKIDFYKNQDYILEELEEKEVKKKYTVKDLKIMCKEKGITGYSNLKEGELIELLKDVI